MLEMSKSKLSSTISYNTDWCEIARIDGVDIKDGERLRIQFPDGLIGEFTVHLEHCDYETNDMGHRVTIPVTHAAIAGNMYGLRHLIRLPAGTPVERV